VRTLEEHAQVDQAHSSILADIVITIINLRLATCLCTAGSRALFKIDGEFFFFDRRGGE
jgi:hypothetical protein